MLLSAKLSTIVFAASLLPLGVLGISGAAAQQRCEGTLCDLYYGKTSSFDDKPAAAPTPVTVPRGTIMGMFDGSNARQAAAAAGAPVPAAPSKPPLVGVGGGGLAAMARGERAEQCSGTLCDFYYGKSSSFDDEKPQQPAAAAAAQAPMAEASADAPPEPAPVDARGFDAQPEPPRCVSKGRDPWSCFR